MTKVNTPVRFVGDGAGTLYVDLFIALSPLLLMAVFSFGLRVLVVCAVSVAAALLTQALAEVLMGKKPSFCPTPVITGLILALLCPATISYWLVAAGSIFAIAVAKMPFGGLGHNPFNPAAAGWCFMALCAPSGVFSYPSYGYGLQISIFGTNVPEDVSLAGMLRNGTAPDVSYFEILLGRIAGPMGTSVILLCIASAIYLLFRGTVRWQAPVAFVATCALFALLFPRIGSRLDSALLELMAGSLLFSAVFMLTDPVTSPKKPVSLLLFGFIAGILTMLFRYFGVLELGAPFAVLIANALSPGLDRMVYFLEKGGVRFGRQT